MKLCTRCNTEKDRSEFYSHGGRKDGLQPWCKVCQIGYMAEKRFSKKVLQDAQTPEPGVYPGVPPDTYHAWDAASNSALSHLFHSAAHLKAYLEENQNETQPMFVGRATHAAVLEPDRFKAEYGYMPEGVDRRTKDGKQAYAELTEKYGDGNVLTHNDYIICACIRDSVYRKQTASALLKGTGEVELSLVWRDKETGVLCKARWDRHSPEIAGGAIVDFKTTKDASKRAFEKAIFNYGYHRQGAMYLMGARAHALPAEHFSIIAAEKTSPFESAVYRITEGTLEAGEEQIRALLRRYAECLMTGEFPGYPDEVCDITVPDWAWRVMDSQIDEIEETR